MNQKEIDKKLDQIEDIINELYDNTNPKTYDNITKSNIKRLGDDLLNLII